jgi:hypothetical protein
MIKDEDWIATSWYVKHNNIFYSISTSIESGQYNVWISFQYDKSFFSLQEAKDYVNKLIKEKELK